MANDFENPLLPIWDNYQVAKAALIVAQKAVETGRDELWTKTSFWDIEKEAANPPAIQSIVASRTALDESIIVALWATFERILIEYVQNTAATNISNRAHEFTKAMKTRMDSEIERWSIDAILDLYGNSFVDKNLIGQVIQIKKSRNWIAHRNPKSAPKGKVVGSDYAFGTLSGVLEAIHHVA